MKKLIYLDYAAATPLDQRVLEAMRPYFSERFYNPSATYLVSKGVKKDLDGARASVAHWLGARPAEVIFTAGGTEANNLAIRGVMERHPEGNVVVSAIEHESVLAPAHEYDCREVAVLPDGTIDLEALEKSIDDKTVLVSVAYANSEIGTVQPLKKVAQAIKSKVKSRKSAGNTTPLLLHTDAAQAANYLDLHASRLGVDLMTINGGKIYGPKQSGALFVRAGLGLKPQVLGGGQEQGIRSGTENVAQSVGLAAALELAQQSRHDETTRLRALRELFFGLLKENIPSAQVNGSRKRRLPNNVHATFPGVDNERLLIRLDEAGIMAAAGSACSASSQEPSHVLRAIGRSADEARSSLRFTMGHGTTEADVRSCIDTLKRLLSE